MIFVQDITERFLINVEKIDYIDHKPDGRWYVVVRNRQFEIAEKMLEHLKEFFEGRLNDENKAANEVFGRVPTVDDIPVEWIKQWRKDKWFSKKPIEERIIMAMGVRLMLEDWEEENAKAD